MYLICQKLLYFNDIYFNYFLYEGYFVNEKIGVNKKPPAYAEGFQYDNTTLL